MSTTIEPSAPEQVQESKADKKKRNRKPLYPLAEGVKVDKTPEDYDFEKQRMTPAQFTDRACYVEHQAATYEHKAKLLREEAADRRVNPDKYKGGKGTQKKAKLLNRLQKLEAKLAELGVDVGDLFGDEDDE